MNAPAPRHQSPAQDSGDISSPPAAATDGTLSGASNAPGAVAASGTHDGGFGAATAGSRGPGLDADPLGLRGYGASEVAEPGPTIAERVARRENRAAAEEARAGAAPHASFFGWSYLIAVGLGLIPVFITADVWMIPVVAMTIYAFAGHGKARESGTMFEFADSIYYLGFTLSVGSLLASLQPFNVHSRPDPEQIFHLFGLGMMSTLLGVVLRTALQTFHRVPTETIEAVNVRLTEEARNYVDRLHALRNHIDTLLTQMVTRYEAEILPKLTTIGSSLDVAVANLDFTASATALLKHRTDAADAALGTMLEGYTTSTKAVAREQAALVEATTALSDALMTARDATHASSHAMASELESVGASATHAGVAIAGLGSRIDGISIDPTPLTIPILAAGRAVAGAADAANAEIAALTDAVQRFRTAADAAREVGHAITEPAFRTALGQLAGEVVALREAVTVQRNATNTEVGSLRAQVSAALATAQDLSRAMDEVTNVALRRLEQLTPQTPTA